MSIVKIKFIMLLDKMELDKNFCHHIKDIKQIVENYIFDLNNEFAFTMIKEHKNKT